MIELTSSDSAYVIISVLGVGALIWILQIYIKQNAQVLKEIQKAIARLETAKEVHDQVFVGVNARLKILEKEDMNHDEYMSKMMKTLDTMTTKLQNLQLVLEEKPRKYHNR